MKSIINIAQAGSIGQQLQYSCSLSKATDTGVLYYWKSEGKEKSLPMLGWFITTTSSRKVTSLRNRVYIYCYYRLTLFINYKVHSGNTGSFLYFSCCTSSTHRRVSSVQFSHSVVSDSATLWTAARQASLTITNSRSLLKLVSIESVMPSNHLILCCPLLLLPSFFPSIRVFSNDSFLPIKLQRI